MRPDTAPTARRRKAPARGFAQKALAPPLLAWFDVHRRDLPWRSPPGEVRDPYHVWLAEIMLQQTTVPHAAPYFAAFTARWPNVAALAAADDVDVMAAWAGLGYYARARNLLKCAREVAARGGFPQTEAELRALPGIGPYTAGAIAAIAFDARAAAVDGNVERVFARLMAIKADWPEAKKQIAACVREAVPEARAGDFAEALMDLGATVCTPTQPACGRCPLAAHCRARAEGNPVRYPLKPKKRALPHRVGHAFILIRHKKVWLVRRPPQGLLGGMLALPSGAWRDDNHPPSEAPASADWTRLGEVRHVFTHFSLSLTVWQASGHGVRPRGEGEWISLDSAPAGLPTVFRKALRLAQTSQ